MENIITLDLLPFDVLNIINNMVKNDYIIDRRLERKKNRKNNREQKIKAEKRFNIQYKFKWFYKCMLRYKYMKKIEGHKDYYYLRWLINKIWDDNHVYNTYEYKYGIIDLILNDFVIIE
jgi:hypothetical protein